MGPQYAGTLGLLAMSATLFRSWINGIDSSTALVTAVLYMFAFALIGFFVGSLAAHVVANSVIDDLKRELLQRAAEEAAKNEPRVQ
jgi:uncharacterized membrane protein YfcA